MIGAYGMSPVAIVAPSSRMTPVTERQTRRSQTSATPSQYDTSSRYSTNIKKTPNAAAGRQKSPKQVRQRKTNAPSETPPPVPTKKEKRTAKTT